LQDKAPILIDPLMGHQALVMFIRVSNKSYYESIDIVAKSDTLDHVRR